jgi:hypothetical protein
LICPPEAIISSMAGFLEQNISGKKKGRRKRRKKKKEFL